MLTRFWENKKQKEDEKKKDEKKEKKKNLIAFVDYENMELSPDSHRVSKIFDFPAFMKRLSEIGNVCFAFVFSPYQASYELAERINDLGYELIVCQKRRVNSQKLEDSVDIHIIRFGWKFLRFEDVTDIVIASDDKHMVELVRDAKSHGKSVHIFGTDNMSYVLKNSLEPEHIHKAPFKKAI